MIPELAKLWKRVLAGDTVAWRTLVGTYSSLVFTVARRAGLSETDSEDCVQDIWLSLYKTRRTIKDPQALPAWLIRTTHRRAVAVRKRLRRLELHQREDSHRAPHLPDHELLIIEREFLLREALRHLDPRCHLLIEKLYLDRQASSYKDLADAIGLSANGLGPLRSRCLAKLARILKKSGLVED